MNAGPKHQSGVHYKSDVQQFMEDPRTYWAGLTDSQRLVFFTLFRMALVYAFPAVVVPVLKESLETSFFEYKTPENLLWIYDRAMRGAWFLLVACCLVFVYILYLARVNKLKAIKSKDTPKGLNTPMQWCITLAMVILSLAHTTKEFADHVGGLLGLEPLS